MAMGLMAFFFLLAVIEVSGFGSFWQDGIAGEHVVESWRDGEAFFGELDGGFEEFAPWHDAVIVVGLFEHGEESGGADGDSADHGVWELDGLVLGVEEEGGFGFWRGRFRVRHRIGVFAFWRSNG